MTAYQIRLEKFMAEVYSLNPHGIYDLYFSEKYMSSLEGLATFRGKCEEMLSLVDQMNDDVAYKKEGYV